MGGREDLERRIRLKNGEEIVLILAEDGSGVTACAASGEEIGALELREEEDGSYFLIRAFLEGGAGRFKRRGIGRAALRFHIAAFGRTIRAADHDGNRRDDGAHLTGDAPSFVAAMRAEGLIAPGTLDEGMDDDGF